MPVQIGDTFTIKNRPLILAGTYTVIDIYTTRNEEGEVIRRTALVKDLTRENQAMYSAFEVPLSTVTLNKK